MVKTNVKILCDICYGSFPGEFSSARTAKRVLSMNNWLIGKHHICPLHKYDYNKYVIRGGMTLQEYQRRQKWRWQIKKTWKE